MAEQLTTVLENAVERELSQPPHEVARFAPAKLRPATISTIVADARKSIADVESHISRLRIALDDLQRFAN